MNKSIQHNVIGLSLKPISNIGVAFVGLGERGCQAVERWCNLSDVRIVALCDVNDDNVNEANRIIGCYNKPQADAYSGFDAYRKMFLRSDIGLVYICTDWQSHVDIALCAMENMKNVAIEVPAALTVDDAWKLVDCAERKRVHCMMLENTLYDYFEMAVQGMCKDGLFGDIIHAEGGYAHTLGNRWNPWRIKYNCNHCGDLYPTHGLGPVCKALDIHFSDNLDYLVSVESNSFLGREIYKDILGEDCKNFINGDQTTTLIRTMRGRTIVLNHNVMSPRPYDRMFQIVGTHGYVSKYPKTQILLDKFAAKILGMELHEETLLLSDSQVEELVSKYTPKYVNAIKPIAERLDSRGGMSYYMDYRLAECLHKGEPLDMDVYDLAEWCSISELSRMSIQQGSMPMKIPDFVRNR